MDTAKEENGKLSHYISLDVSVPLLLFSYRMILLGEFCRIFFPMLYMLFCFHAWIYLWYGHFLSYPTWSRRGTDKEKNGYLMPNGRYSGNTRTGWGKRCARPMWQHLTLWIFFYIYIFIYVFKRDRALCGITAREVSHGHSVMRAKNIKIKPRYDI